MTQFAVSDSIIRLLSNLHFVSAYANSDETLEHYKPNQNTVIMFGTEYVDAVSLADIIDPRCDPEDRGLYLIFKLRGLEDADWISFNNFNSKMFSVYKKDLS